MEVSRAAPVEALPQPQTVEEVEKVYCHDDDVSGVGNAKTTHVVGAATIPTSNASGIYKT